jgi:hypothetical protein
MSLSKKHPLEISTYLFGSKAVSSYYHVIVICLQFVTLSVPCVGRDSSVGIATRYGLDGPGI